VALKRMDVGKLEYPDGAFDTVVSTFALCTMTSPLAALSEMRRVCRAPPRAGGDARDGGGRVLLLEHTRSDFGPLAAYQDATASLIAPVAKGCVWNQDVEALAAQVGDSPRALSPTIGNATMRALERCEPARESSQLLFDPLIVAVASSPHRHHLAVLPQAGLRILSTELALAGTVRLIVATPSAVA
jgi:SAM-dependent methyltransferase